MGPREAIPLVGFRHSNRSIRLRALVTSVPIAPTTQGYAMMFPQCHAEKTPHRHAACPLMYRGGGARTWPWWHAIVARPPRYDASFTPVGCVRRPADYGTDRGAGMWFSPVHIPCISREKSSVLRFLHTVTPFRLRSGAPQRGGWLCRGRLQIDRRCGARRCYKLV